MSITNKEILGAESSLRAMLHDPADPYPVPLTYDAELIDRQLAQFQAKYISILIGTGPGGRTYAHNRTSRGHHVLAFEKTTTPRGKLELVAPHKPLLREGLLEAFTTFTRPYVYTYLNTPVDFTGSGEGIPLCELVDLTGAKEVIFATGTKERRTKLTTGEDLGIYKGHSYAYELIGEMNKWMNRGQNLADFPLDWNEAGDQVVISGAGFVAMEDMSKLILAWQILRKLNQIGVDITKFPDESSQFQFASLPLSKLAEMYKDTGENSQKIKTWLGKDLVLTGQDASIVLLNRLYELGIKPTKILYRKSKLDLNDNKLTAFSKLGGFTLAYNSEPGSVETKGNQIKSLTLIHGEYNGNTRISYQTKETIQPAYVISALGGESSPIEIDKHPLEPDKPLRINNVTYAVIGNAVAGKGNKAKTIDSTREVLVDIDRYVSPTPTIKPDALTRTLVYLEALNYLPANVILETLLHTPPLLQQKWGWNKL